MPAALHLVTNPAPAPAPTSASASPEAFAEAMSARASGVVLVTCWVGDRPWGMTATAFASVSANPPTVLVSLGSQTSTARAIAATGTFGVSLLAADQVALARYGSTPGAAKFLEPWTEAGAGREPGASPAVAGALAHLDCEVAEAVRVADHTVVFGRVRAARSSRTGAPLVYQRRAYATLADAAAGHPSLGRPAAVA